MRLILSVIVVVLFASVILWVQGGQGFHIAESLPFLSGRMPAWPYIVGGLAFLLITIRGVRNMVSPPRPAAANEPESIDEEPEAFEEDVDRDVEESEDDDEPDDDRDET